MKLFSKLTCVITIAFSLFLTGVAHAQVTPAAYNFTRNLTLGIRGGDVSALQQFLIDRNFLAIDAPTGYFGMLTRSALAAWQRSEGIMPAVGFFGMISRGKINAIALSVPLDAIVVRNDVAVPSVPTTAGTNGFPIRLTIAKLGVDAGFQYNNIKPDGTLEIPSNIVDVGWFTGSARPGEKGVAIVTGHVAQIRGGIVTKPGVFANLSMLRPGDTLTIQNDKGTLFTFVVRESRNYDPAADATSVFSSTDGGIHLNLITCEGTWNPNAQSYSQRLVVFTDMVR